MTQILIIVNPSSGSKTGVTVGNSLQEIFRRKNKTTSIYETTGEDDFENFFRKGMNQGLEIVVALGGDGTVSEVVDGLSRLEKRPQLLPLPLGTTNNFVRALGTEVNPDLLLEAIEKDQLQEKEVDVGWINDQYFISTVSAGSIPEVAWQTDNVLKERMGSVAYILEGMSAINDFEAFDIKIQTDNEVYQLDNVFLMVIGLSNSIFGIQTFFKEASYDDGKLYLYILKQSNFFNEASSIARHILSGDNVEKSEDEYSLVTSFKKASIITSEKMGTAVDGEKGPEFPLDIEVLHKHITVIVPVV